MSSHMFTPSDIVDPNKERDWAAGIGLMDWDTTKIVFTKRSLIEFLKYTGVTVDTNFTNISKLPRYAIFGKLEDEKKSTGNNDQEGTAESGNISQDFRPSRRVRTTPGGPSSGIFDSEEPDGALADAPPLDHEVFHESGENGQGTSGNVPIETSQDRPPVRPSRRVRTAPGGKDSLSELWGTSSETNEFKPTRRVRQGPGGTDSVGSLLGA